ncbi:MAG: O-antigen ligase family protein, partial [Clostridia bacterium]|nr:O-antigen ligase family protein [Clostridia bacterium]
LCLVFTYSRGAWLALVGSFILYCILTKPQAILALIVAALAAVKLSPGIGSRMTYLFSSGYVSSSLKAGRLSRWDNALDQLSQNLWLGQGLGRFGGAVAARNIPGSYYVDNFYLKTAVECGLIGLLALLWLFLNALRLGAWTLRQVNSSNRWLAVGLICGLFGVLLHCTVENIFEVPLMCVYFWLVVGMLAILPNQQS